MGDLLVDSDFYRHEHRLIYAAIGALINASKPADVITVSEYIQNQGKIAEMGGLGYLNSLAQYVPSASNIRRYAEIVRERSILRKLVSASDEIATNAFNPQGKAIDRILDEAEQKIFNIGEERLAHEAGLSVDGHLGGGVARPCARNGRQPQRHHGSAHGLLRFGPHDIGSAVG